MTAESGAFIVEEASVSKHIQSTRLSASLRQKQKHLSVVVDLKVWELYLGMEEVC